MKRRSLFAVLALVVASIVPFGTALASTGVPTRHLSSKGGTVAFSGTVKNATTCEWSSSPKVAGFDRTEKCSSGKVERSAKVKANKSTKAKDFTLTLTVRGKATKVLHLQVVEAGSTTTATTTTTITASTTTTTTEPFVFDQPTTTTYFAFGSYNSGSGGSYSANEYADVTINSFPNLSPGGGTVTFRDADGSLICVATLDSNPFSTTVGCFAGSLSTPPPNPITVSYSGTQTGYDDGYGTSYGASSGSGSPG